MSNHNRKFVLNQVFKMWPTWRWRTGTISSSYSLLVSPINFLKTVFWSSESTLTIQYVLNIKVNIRHTFVQNYFIYKNKMAPSDSRAAIYMHRSDRQSAILDLPTSSSQQGPWKSTSQGQGHFSDKTTSTYVNRRFLFPSLNTIHNTICSQCQ